MPKKTFMNLPEEKQQRLLDAGFQEFSRVPADEASINNIIKLAAIPRGSFYQYFEDKFDLHEYIVQLYSQKLKNSWVTLLKTYHGNLFTALPIFFEEFLDELTNEKQVDFWKNTFTSFRNLNLSKKHLETKHLEINHAFIDEVDENLLKIDLSSENLELLRRQIITMMMQSVHCYFFDKRLGNENPREDAIKQFNIMLNWLEYGIRK
ncbi:TetR/AcrR family transcriptional regulator [Ligilactobacillus cholophilus]|uniref:TetR/AcrR family transcriptional regulator n=1 Tax=Ligilactobacillus cholophilus TaxID=3050131 RepID=UPI0025B02E26|nr:TetR/AcrR family transcriptional regulator [Ligilactobacillus cholophilus]